jgi:hypothetical protein
MEANFHFAGISARSGDEVVEISSIRPGGGY